MEYKVLKRRNTKWLENTFKMVKHPWLLQEHRLKLFVRLYILAHDPEYIDIKHWWEYMKWVIHVCESVN